MSNEFTFDQNAYQIPTILVQENEVWQTESEQYNQSADNSLSDNINDSYLTAVDASNNSTQYFSVLGSSSETVMNDMSQITLEDAADENINYFDEEGKMLTEANSQEVILFSVQGSENLYGIQIAEDEEGNLQKYQFQVCQNADGQFETVPGTIQVMPFDSDTELAEKLIEENITNEEIISNEQIVDPEINNETIDEQIFIKQEFMNEDSEDINEDQLQVDEADADYIEEDTKEGIIAKREIHYKQQVLENDVAEEDIEAENHEDFIEEAVPTVEEECETEEEITFHQLYFNEGQEIEENDENCEDNNVDKNIDDHEEEIIHEANEIENLQEHIQMFVPETTADSYDSQNSEYNEIMEENGSNNEFDEEMPVTDDGEEQEEEEEIEEDYEHILMHDDYRLVRPKVLKMESHLETISDSPVKSKRAFTYVVSNAEKENRNSLKAFTIKKGSPRSILKSSVVLDEQNEPEYEKRFFKGKVAVQARQLHNYISQTTILQAPIRQERLPRKQKIKPLKRSGEEIVVQEVVVSSNGFIETREGGVLMERKPLIPTECIQLSDSDDDDPNSGKKRKRKSKKSKAIEIIISDSESEDLCGEEANLITSPKKKNGGKSSLNKEEVSNFVTKKNLENKCTKCPKAFPSLGSLRTHMQYHNYEESNTKKMKNINLQSKQKNTFKKPSEVFSRHKCSECNENFKNNILLTKHINLHKNKTAKIECNICKKLFTDKSQLAVHKRMHIKDHMVKNTTLIKISPKKAKQTSPKLVSKVSPKKVPPKKKLSNVAETFKCNLCSKVFSSALLLNSHEKTHKRFACKSCSNYFSSKLLLDNHLLRNCVKSPQRGRRITSNMSMRANTTIHTKLNNIKCDTCTADFLSYKDLFRHKVLTHGLATPDKNVGKENANKSLYKQSREHSGIPASKKLKSAFNQLINNLEN